MTKFQDKTIKVKNFEIKHGKQLNVYTSRIERVGVRKAQRHFSTE